MLRLNNTVRVKHQLTGTAINGVHKRSSVLNIDRQALIYFVLTVSGFSFWFFIAAPFASHRESYSWLAEVWQGRLRDSLTMFGVGTTWRPFGEFVTWLGFTALNPRIFPTSAL